MRIHLAIQYPLTEILSKVRKNASRHLQMPQGVLYILSSPGACEALCEMEFLARKPFECSYNFHEAQTFAIT